MTDNTIAKRKMTKGQTRINNDLQNTIQKTID